MEVVGNLSREDDCLEDAVIGLSSKHDFTQSLIWLLRNLADVFTKTLNYVVAHISLL
jgi:hypothetical protein